MSIYIRTNGVIHEMRDGRCRPFQQPGTITPIQHVFARTGGEIRRIWPTVNINKKIYNITAFSNALINTDGMAIGIRFASNGEVFNGNNSNGQTIDNWSPWVSGNTFNIAFPEWITPTPGVGNGYEILFATGTITGGTIPTFSLSRGVWYSLSQDRSMVLTIPSGLRAMQWESTVSIRDLSTGQTSVAGISFVMEIQ